MPLDLGAKDCGDQRAASTRVVCDSGYLCARMFTPSRAGNNCGGENECGSECGGGVGGRGETLRALIPDIATYTSMHSSARGGDRVVTGFGHLGDGKLHLNYLHLCIFACSHVHACGSTIQKMSCLWRLTAPAYRPDVKARAWPELRCVSLPHTLRALTPSSILGNPVAGRGCRHTAVASAPNTDWDRLASDAEPFSSLIESTTSTCSTSGVGTHSNCQPCS